MSNIDVSGILNIRKHAEWVKRRKKNTHKRTFKLKSFEKRNDILISSSWSTGFHKEKITEMTSIILQFVLFFFIHMVKLR